MTTWSNVDCQEIQDTRRENWDGQGSSASVSLLCAYGDRYSLVTDLLENSRAYPFNSTSPIDLFAWNAGVSTLSSEKDTSADNAQVMIKESAVVNVNYRLAGGGSGFTGTTPDGQQVQLEDRFESQTDNIELDSSMFSGRSDVMLPLPPNRPVMVQKKRFVLVRSIRGLRTINSSLLNLPGKVNEDPYTSVFLGNLTFAPETLLFDDPFFSRNTQRLQLNTLFTWDLTLRFVYEPLGWNKMLNPFLPIEPDGEGNINFNTISSTIYWAPYGNLPFPKVAPYPKEDFSTWLF